MRSSIIFEKLLNGNYFGVSPETERVEFCSNGLFEWLGIIIYEDKHKRFRLTVRKTKFPHSFKVFTSQRGSRIRKTKQGVPKRIFVSLTYWLGRKYPELFIQYFSVLYARIEWLGEEK